MSEAEPLLPEFRGYFEHLREGRLAFQLCEACGRFHWYPMPRCPHCRSERLVWRPVAGRGEVFSFTRVQHAFDKARRDELPYVVALVTFADAPGVRLVANVVGADAAALGIGEEVEPVFPAEGAHDIVLFRRTKPAAPG